MPFLHKNNTMKFRLILFLILSLGVLAGLWWLWPKPVAPVADADTPMATAGYLIHWRVEAGQRMQGPAKFAVRVGDTITLEVASDRDDVLHIHGDGLKVPLLADKNVRIDWTPAHSGHFDLELHHSGLTLTQVAVLPR